MKNECVDNYIELNDNKMGCISSKENNTHKLYKEIVPNIEDSNINHDILLKVIFVGNESVGKSSLIYKYTKQFKLLADSCPTIGVEFHEKKICHTKLHIWDTSGRDRFVNVAEAYMKNCDIMFFVYDVTDINSLNIIKKRYNEKFSTCDNLILVGNKCDLPNRQISSNDGKMFAGLYGMEHIETSIYDDILFDKFKHLIVEIVNRE